MGIALILLVKVNKMEQKLFYGIKQETQINNGFHKLLEMDYINLDLVINLLYSYPLKIKLLTMEANYK